MYRFFYKPNDSWVGDIIPFYENGTFYLYYLRECRIRGIPAEKTSWALITTDDFFHFEEKGIILPAGSDNTADRSCYTGSVLRGNDGEYHLYYTAQNNINPKFMYRMRPLQYAAHASGHDLLHWEKDSSFLLCASKHCEIYDWRDPFVFYSPLHQCYLMLLAARKNNGSLRRDGILYYMKSEDLKTWSDGGIFYAPEMYMTLECPDCFQIGDWWYLVFSTFSEKYTTHYRMSRSLCGPWLTPADDAFDGRAFYAAKTVHGKNGHYLTGWVPTKLGDSDFGKWEWGGSLAVHELYQETDGSLSVRPPLGLTQKLKNTSAPSFFRATGSADFDGRTARLDGTASFCTVIFDSMPRHGCIRASLSFSEEISSFGIQLHTDSSFDCGYCYRFEPLYQRVVFDQWPRAVLSNPVIPNDFENDRPFDAGLERHITLLPGQPIELTLLTDDDICTLYINSKIALTARCYNFTRPYWGLFSAGGQIAVSEITCAVV